MRHQTLTESEARLELLLADIDGEEKGDELLKSVGQSDSPPLCCACILGPLAIDLQTHNIVMNYLIKSAPTSRNVK